MIGGVDPWDSTGGRNQRPEDLESGSWRDMYTLNGVDAELGNGEEPVVVTAEPPERPVSGTATPGSDAYEPRKDSFRYRQSIRDAVQDPWRDDVRPLTL